MPNSPIRVAFCIDTMQVGGTELNAVRTAELLERSRVELRVVCLQEHGPLLERYAAAGVPVHTLPGGSFYRPSTVGRARALAALLRLNRVEVLHAHDVYSNVFAVPVARLAGVRTIASRRWWGGMPGTLWRTVTRAAYRAADAVLVNSPSLAGLVQGEGVPPRRVRFVPNFVNESMFTTPLPAERERRRRALGIPADRPVVGTVANLLPVKNQAMLLRAAARLRDTGTQLHVVLVGDGPERDALQRLTAELGLADLVTFTGRLPNHPNLHHMFDISVLCSDSEGMSNSLLEAMAAGRPVVATRVGALADAVVEGENGALVPPGDDAALADALGRLVADPGLAARMGRRAHERARQQHSPGAAIGALESLYRELAPRPGPVLYREPAHALSRRTG